MLLRFFQCIFLLGIAAAAVAETKFAGHAKYFYTYSDFPENSVFSSDADPYQESLANLRLKLATHSGSSWSSELDYEVNAIYSADLNNCFIRAGLAGYGCTTLVSDQSQLFDLSSIISETENALLYQRIDRLTVTYSSEKLVTRAGRQAISWGNGMVYNPLDLFNPFAPAAIDKEYKRGEDMLYLQGLFRNGSDLQILYIPRRDPVDGDVRSNQSAVAGKYHWLGSTLELDIMAAKNYGDSILGAAYTGEWHENVINASATMTQTEGRNYFSAAASYVFSSSLSGRNLSGFIELFYNGFGLGGRQNSVNAVIQQQALFSRLLRGELFTVGKYYLSASAIVEITALLSLNPVLFVNLGDGSAMLQVSGTYSLGQNLDLLGGFNLPAGAEGTEFGGLLTDAPAGEILAPAKTLFARLAWYF